MKPRDCEQLTLFPAASHNPASHLVVPGSAEAKRMTVTSGRKCLELSESCDPLGALAKMLVESSVWQSPCRLLEWRIKHFSERRNTTVMKRYYHDRKKCLSQTLLKTLKVSGTGRTFTYYQLAVLEPGIKDTEYLLLPTPTATIADHGGPNQRDSSGRPGLQQAAMMWPTPTTRDHKDGTAQSCQNVPVNCLLGRAVHMWPTPTASDSMNKTVGNPIITKHGTVRHQNKAGGQSRMSLQQVAMFATPQARDFRTGQQSRWENEGRSRNLNDQIGGQLNPDWVELLMGLPVGYTQTD